MEYEVKDEKTGKITRYEVSYSQELQKRVAMELRRSNWLKIILIAGFVMLTIAWMLLWFNTGTIGYIMRRAVCP